MKQPDLRTLLHDAETAAVRIEKFLGNLTSEEYRANELVKAAVERQFEIIGEALGKAVKVDPELQVRVTALSRVVAFRNQLIHGYFGIDAEVVWAVAKDHLPTLLQEVRTALTELQRDSE